MPPFLALILCTAFVLFLLRLERKQSPNVSHALWIPTIWMLLISSKPLGVWFGSPVLDADIPDAAEGSLLDRNFLIGLFCIGLFFLIKKKLNWSIVIKKNPLLLLLFGYMFVSILWTDMPFVSFKRFFKQFIAIIMALVVATEISPKQAMLSLLRRTVYIHIPVSLLLIKYFPFYGVQYGRWSGGLMWVGVCTQKNGLGLLCTITIFFLFCMLFISWREQASFGIKHKTTYPDLFIAILSLYLLIGSGSFSATAICTLVVALSTFICIFLFKNNKNNIFANQLTWIIVFIIIYGVITPFIGRLSLIDISFIFGRDETLTGRSGIWERLLEVAMERPIFGHGFGGFWTPLTREIYYVSGSHNGYLDVLLELGFLGLVPIVLYFFSSARTAQKILRHDFYWASLWLSYLIIVVVHNITESTIVSFSNLLMAVALLFLICSASSYSQNPRIKHIPVK